MSTRHAHHTYMGPYRPLSHSEMHSRAVNAPKSTVPDGSAYHAAPALMHSGANAIGTSQSHASDHYLSLRHPYLSSPFKSDPYAQWPPPSQGQLRDHEYQLPPSQRSLAFFDDRRDGSTVQAQSESGQYHLF